MTRLNGIALLCALSAWLVRRRAHQHRPVAVALSLCAGLDAFRGAAALPPRVDLALALGAPLASMWLYAKAWRYPSGDTWGEVALMWATSGGFVLLAPQPEAWWDALMPGVYTAAILTGCLAIIRNVTIRHEYPGDREIAWSGSPWTATQHVALALLAGDVAGLLLLCRREWISYQAGVVLGLVTVYQVGWYWRQRYGMCGNRDS